MDMRRARFIRSLTRSRIQPHVGRAHARLLRASRGRLRRSRTLAGGQPVLALTTTGRRSGRPRTTTVAYLEHGDAHAVSAMNLGSDHHPGWCLNLRTDPNAWIELSGERHAVRAREASGAEADRLWERYIERLPLIADSRKLARREIPMFVLEPRAEP